VIEGGDRRLGCRRPTSWALPGSSIIGFLSMRSEESNEPMTGVGKKGGGGIGPHAYYRRWEAQTKGQLQKGRKSRSGETHLDRIVLTTFPQEVFSKYMGKGQNSGTSGPSG